MKIQLEHKCPLCFLRQCDNLTHNVSLKISLKSAACDALDWKFDVLINAFNDGIWKMKLVV